MSYFDEFMKNRKWEIGYDKATSIMPSKKAKSALDASYLDRMDHRKREDNVGIDAFRQELVEEELNEEMLLQELEDKHAVLMGGVSPPGEHRECETLVYYPRSKSIDDYDSDRSIHIPEIPYLNVRDLMARFFLTAHLTAKKVKNWRDYCVGISSTQTARTREEATALCQFHMPMFDYDGSNVKSKIRKDVKILQLEFSLGDAWVYKTKRGYHVYFFTDNVAWEQFDTMLQQVQCCKGFRKVSRSRQAAVLRVSAKYTEFDISLQYVLRSKIRSENRVSQKGHVVQSLLQMGQDCNTHVATLFADQVYYEEDETVWRSKGPGGKRIRKIKKIPHQSAIAVGKQHWVGNATIQYTTAADTSTTGFSAYNTWHNSG